jgi:hypothetical protein
VLDLRRDREPDVVRMIDGRDPIDRWALEVPGDVHAGRNGAAASSVRVR